MTAPVRVLFRVDAGVALGLGHVSRCRSLMLALSRLAACHFAVVTASRDVVQRTLPDIDCDLYEVGEPIRGARFDAAIVDVPGGVKENFHEVADLLVCMDDSGPGLDDQDILIRPNLLNLPRPAGMSEDRYWTGHVLLHPDFATHPLPVENAHGSRELFVCFGGTDPCGITVRAVPVLNKLSVDVRIRIVLGGAFPWDDQLTLMLGGNPRFLIERNVPDMARVLRSAAVALISGGTLLYEACASGVPSIVICQNEEQRAEADVAAATGAVISLGVNANVCDENILSAVERLLEDPVLRHTMAGRGRSLVAPDGAAQVAARLLSCLRRRDAV